MQRREGWREETPRRQGRACRPAQLWGRPCAHIGGAGRGTHLAKLARFWVTLAMRVSVRAVRSSGYSCSRLKSEGDMMAGQRKRRNREALMSRSLMSGRPRLLHSCRQEANTSLSSRGKTLCGDGAGAGQLPGWDQSRELVLGPMEPSSVPCPPRRLHDGPTPEFSEPTPPPSTIRGAGTLGEPGQHRAGTPRPQLVGLPEGLSERGHQHWGQVPQGFTPAPLGKRGVLGSGRDRQQ